MDVSTQLVRAYLHVNGYFTTTEYPLVESRRAHPPRMRTDIDLMAVRFPRRATPEGTRDGSKTHVSGPVAAHCDPVLGAPADATDMIVAEIKQGRAQVNPAARDRQVLAAALARFGCCHAGEAPDLVQELLQHGRARGESQHVIRMVLFASHGDSAPRGWHWVHLDHVFRYLDDYLHRHQRVLAGVDLRDPALSWLSLLRKCEITLSVEGPSS